MVAVFIFCDSSKKCGGSVNRQLASNYMLTRHSEEKKGEIVMRRREELENPRFYITSGKRKFRVMRTKGDLFEAIHPIACLVLVKRAKLPWKVIVKEIPNPEPLSESLANHKFFVIKATVNDKNVCRDGYYDIALKDENMDLMAEYIRFLRFREEDENVIVSVTDPSLKQCLGLEESNE